jgi:C4-dicarboxylate-specific signal transduction histidine kinase
VNRVTTLGELTASLAHEVNQPIAAAVTDANTCLRWLTRDHPDVEEARAAAARAAKDATRAAEIISRVRLLFKKAAPERELVDTNEVIPRMIALLYGEAARYNIAVRAELAADLPHVIGDRVQLQQVLMNLIVNSIDAMKDVDGPRELVISSQRTENAEVLVSVIDTGVGLPQQQASQIFNAFFTTKNHGTGLGFGSAARSSNRTAGVCGLPTTHHAAQAFISRCLPKLRHRGDASHLRRFSYARLLSYGIQDMLVTSAAKLAT